MEKQYIVPTYFKTASPDRYELLKSFAKENRNNPTEAEKMLWSIIKGNALGTKFLRQHVIQDYIVDFVALEAYLIIEVMEVIMLHPNRWIGMPIEQRLGEDWL